MIKTTARLFSAAFQTVPEGKIRRIGELLDSMEGQSGTIQIERCLVRLMDAAEELNAAHAALVKVLEGGER